MSAVLEHPPIIVRAMQVDDVKEVLVVEHSAYAHPWSETIIRDCLRVGYHCWVATSGENIVAHAVLSTAVGEAHLLNLCVHPAWQGRGIGRRLLQRMIRVAAQRNADTVFLEVRQSNVAARALYESEGFVEIGQRRGYYPAGQGREDALVFAKTLL